MTLLQHCTLQEHVFNGQGLATMLASIWWSSGQDMGLSSIGMANSKSSYYNLLISCEETSTIYRYTPLHLNLLLDIGVYLWLQICMVRNSQWFYSWSRVSFSSWLTIITFNATMTWHPAEKLLSINAQGSFTV